MALQKITSGSIHPKIDRGICVRKRVIAYSRSVGIVLRHTIDIYLYATSTHKPYYVIPRLCA